MSERLDFARRYIGWGKPVLILHGIRPNGACTCQKGFKCGTSSGKHPREATGENHLAGAIRDIATAEAKWRKWPNSNVGLVTGEASGLCVVDVDGAEGAALLAKLEAEHEPLPVTMEASSGRVGGGRHLYFEIDGPAPTNDGDGLDIRGTGGLVVAPPSRHASGATYQWVTQNPPARMPPWLLDWFRNREPPQRERTKVDPNLPDWLRAAERGQSLTSRLSASIVPATDYADIRAALDVIPNPDLGWKQWRVVIMAIWAACNGAEWGLELAEYWSAKSKKHNQEGKQTCAEQWAEISRRPPNRLTFGKLYHMAQQAVPGWLPPSKVRVAEPPQVETKPEPAPTGGETAKTPPAEQPRMNGHPSEDTIFGTTAKATSDNPLIRFNEQYAVIGDVGGKCLVLGWINSKIDKTLKVPSFQTFRSFAERYGNQYVTVATKNKKGEDVSEAKQAGATWLKWTHRRTYDGIDLAPGEPQVLAGNRLNLWTGFSVLPAQGSWRLMQSHIYNILAGGDHAAAEYIFRFAAWAVQHPGERAEVALVFRGGKGSGKGTFANALRRLFGQHGLQIFSSRHLVGQFNGHLRNCILLFADEAFWAGDKQGESVLKGLLTEPALMIEQKGIDATPWPNMLHVIMSANAEWVVPASHDERRYAVFDVLPDRIGDFGYFQALHDELTAGGLSAMLYDLQRLDLKGWHPRAIVQTEALRQQKARSLSPLGEWWESVLQAGVLTCLREEVRDNAKCWEASATALLAHAKEYSHRPGDINPTSLGRFLKVMGLVRVHRKMGSSWTIPEIGEARAAWVKKFGAWNWERETKKWNDFPDEPVILSPTSHHASL